MFLRTGGGVAGNADLSSLSDFRDKR